ncbi:hypothetical protein JZ751_021513 [Albula glossodonta]|uniref:Aldehyde dehydrogenase n=1 Tax=Albula glossodonta TaxID=121402 RepID=A0A8T2NME5_9TELE|nr:hypothetical protein JZ751_021513 [Albula glossodonta]
MHLSSQRNGTRKRSFFLFPNSNDRIRNSGTGKQTFITVSDKSPPSAALRDFPQDGWSSFFTILLLNPFAILPGFEAMEGQKEVIDRLQRSFRSRVTLPEQFRLAQLDALLSLIKENEIQILEALHQDLHKLILLPLVGAIAAGNCAILKPSEISQATEKLLAELIPKYLSKECYAVVCGGAEETKTLLENRFDHIFYTGSQNVARSILQAAAIHLTPVTLELGGKCPCLIYGKVDIKAAARRLAWAKFFNAGQSCVAPDYVLCTPQIQAALIPALREALEGFYTAQPQQCPDMGRIVSDRHWDRLNDMLERSAGTVEIGGQSTKQEKYMAPTVLVNVKENDVLMQEEIFGPILPILSVETLEEGIDFMNCREKPLALYVFSDEPQVVTKVLEQTSSGGFCSNDGIVHMTLPGLPFGGVGASGMGSYHGRWGFETFSHRRGCMLRGWGLERINVLRYPPYQETNLSWLRWATGAKKGWSGCSVM